ncbi:ATP-binding cassette domain-containing protein [Lederbergia wuyishanensis]|uniref:ABC-2 type transport system ATP-binding protein n=1 Tax=Lederbergia wuyishanensis TaxID=1347903 RepID=A0ABU0CZ80_9BACI|nr:ABC transporter ATP-binding protein [Lederbergia wuyishanensis]MCJ8006092.1 ABC transporter ATP-binding protein [Lederbergia wuyishanensis]MDQ0341461.1 ABC-2 type transport system ATP-binding protein [Lederbergia wuyishanensis]
MIEINGLTKKYGSFTALDSLTINIGKGIVFGVVGHNGAGKSTAFSILATLLSPTSGTAVINGASVTQEPEKVRKQIGYMPDFFGVYDHLRVNEYLDFYGASYSISARDRAELIPQLLDLVNLTEKENSYVDVLSRGMKQRLCLARSLIHDPEVLILDEPASGLDPRARVEMREILKELKNMGKTILISSHILPELSEMCDQIGVINKGKLVAHGTVADIQHQLQADKVIIVTFYRDVERAISFFEDAPSVSRVTRLENNTIQFQYAGAEESQIKLLKKAILADLPILSFKQLESNLEDVFMEITKGVDLN